MPHSFLAELNMRDRRSENTIVRVDGPCQGGKVNVLYVYAGLKDLGYADGFHGRKWTTICNENQVEPGFIFMFTKKGNHEYSFDLFNSGGLGLDLNVLSDEEVGNEFEEYASEDDERDEMFENLLNHNCSHTEHPHNFYSPHFYKKLESYTVSRNVMTFPKGFVREHNIQSFDEAVIHFGQLEFIVKLEKKSDHRRIDDDTHVVMKADWGSVVEEAGLSLGKILRFELNVEACVAGKTADFDMC